MKSQVWGPTIWYLIHSVAYGIEDDEYFLQHKDYSALFWEVYYGPHSGKLVFFQKNILEGWFMFFCIVYH